jgi:hypothetical protein
VIAAAFLALKANLLIMHSHGGKMEEDLERQSGFGVRTSFGRFTHWDRDFTLGGACLAPDA